MPKSTTAFVPFASASDDEKQTQKFAEITTVNEVKPTTRTKTMDQITDVCCIS